ncbi:GlxA family transcriptional regulator [Viridibacterium curvum]|uniref:HTH araC/xylS-type domain-containing protein n=1 Tax=Viridibacterium curvum TaxID=1101404 RepID=A0ABP9QNP2_9RHOO
MDFTIAVLDGALASSVAITLDALTAASRLSAIRGGRALRWRVLGTGTQAALSSGLSVPTTPLSPRLRLDGSVLLIPGIAIVARPGERYDPASLGERLDAPDAQLLATLAARHHDNGGLVAAGCSAAFILGNAGLLSGRSATTHWRLAGYLQQRQPDCRVDINRMLVVQDRVITAGAALAQMDLMLYLIRHALGAEVADLTMRYLLLDDRDSQAGYMIWSQLNQQDPTVQALEALVEKSLPMVPTLSTLAEALHVSEKTLTRRVRSATGQTAQDLVQAVRLRRARHLLESTRLSLDEIAVQVGYADATALRRLTLKTLNTTPGRLRSGRH